MSTSAAPEAPPAPRLQLRHVAELSGRPLDRVYALFRLPTAPKPAAHVACVPVYDAAAALAHVCDAPGALEAALERLEAEIRPPKSV